MQEMCVEVLKQILEGAIPIAIAFEFGNLIVCTFMRVAFGGRLWYGRD